MAHVTNKTIRAKNDSGEAYDFQSKIAVNSGGKFQCSFPDELEPIVRELLRTKEGYGIYQPKKYLYLLGPDMEKCVFYLQSAIVNYLDTIEKKDLVIVYSSDVNYSICQDKDGGLHPNGTFIEPGEDWSWKGNLHAANCSKVFSLGVGAVVKVKKTYERKTGTTVNYESLCHCQEMEEGVGEFGLLLDAFPTLNIDPRFAKELPYTEETAKFFYKILMGMARTAMQIEDFFSDDQNLLTAIAGGTTPLIGHQ